MTSIYSSRDTALIFIDPYNDFLAEGGKMWPFVQEVAKRVGLLDNLRAVTAAVRKARLRVFVAPHRRFQPGDYSDWAFPSPDQRGVMRLRPFEAGTWGGEWHPDFAPKEGDIVIKEHWGQNSFANTDLHLLLTQHGIRKLIFVGMIANTCIEATARYAMELGYHVTLVTDATAAMSADRMHAAHALNGPNYAHAITDTAGLLEALSALNP
ncbi:cysteine hydrolase [Pyxidicoccus sp. MSG2]|uniref:cysteine hydrolase n=1 Tax=Pyxidicoccus sp. MSG2 TaxID=2996790 RepID=UPI0022712BF8|nr:cysteine hydrolase [Pyxidicoccus sp. MSG2]MCY1017166.1 cysteine hydrolase [Pyxidicoccus sp. MSG2]